MDALVREILANEPALDRCDDTEFVLRAYRLALAREPDPGGFVNYLQRVRAGIPRQQIIAELLDSDEAKTLRRRESRAALQTAHRATSTSFWRTFLARLTRRKALRSAASPLVQPSPSAGRGDTDHDNDAPLSESSTESAAIGSESSRPPYIGVPTLHSSTYPRLSLTPAGHLASRLRTLAKPRGFDRCP